jgi:hypothetical protein
MISDTEDSPQARQWTIPASGEVLPFTPSALQLYVDMADIEITRHTLFHMYTIVCEGISHQLDHLVLYSVIVVLRLHPSPSRLWCVFNLYTTVSTTWWINNNSSMFQRVC